MERQLSELIRGLLTRGGEVTVISRRCDLEPHVRLRWVRVAGPSRPFVLAYPWFFLAGSLLVRRHRRGVLNTTGAIIANRADVCTIHYCHRAGRARRRARKSSLLYRANSGLSRPMSRLGEAFVFRRCKLYVAVSRGLAEEVRQTYPAISNRLVVITNGVDTRRFRPDAQHRREVRGELGVSDSDLLVLFVGSEWESKGLGIAIRAIGAVAGTQLAVVGAGDASRFDAVAHHVGAGGRVHFLGKREDTERYHAAADVFVLPSEYETFSLVAHEAAASGIPLLTTRVHGVDELVVNGHNGWFVERATEPLAARLAALRDDPHQLRTLGEAARVSAKRYDWQKMVRRYVDLYAKAAA